MTDSAPPITLPATDPLAVGVTDAIESGVLHELSRLLNEHPGLASARIAARRKTWRTPLHVVTHWPGYFPNGPAVVRLLIDAGADPSARSAEGPSETPLHWAASNDDVDVTAALIDGGADIEAPGGSIAGGSPLNNAVGYGCWHVARLLVARGATVGELWLAAALGLDQHVEALLDAGPPPQEGLDEAFWQACHGGQLRTAQLLLARGAHERTGTDVALVCQSPSDPVHLVAGPDDDDDAGDGCRPWPTTPRNRGESVLVPGYGDGQTPLEIAASLDERRSQLVRWLGEHGAKTAAKPASPS